MTTTRQEFAVEQLANPELYRRLTAYFGADAVKVLRPGVRSNWVRKLPINGVEGGKRSFRETFDRDNKGEEYQLNCPFCGDSGRRLYINHQWAAWNSTTRSRHRFLICCHNANCLADELRQDRLYSFLFERPLSLNFVPGVVASAKALPDKFDGKTPGVIRPLSSLTAQSAACRYLVDRGYDPLEIERDWGVGVCVSSHSARYAGRLYIPITLAGKLEGWMCRYPGDRVGRATLKEAKVKKYLFAPGMRTSQLLYNLDKAGKRPLLVIVEGATSAWRVGLSAVAIFGNRVHQGQCELLAQVVRDGHVRHIVLMLDPDQSQEEIRRGQAHHSLVAERTLRPWLGRTPLTVLRLPAGTDPGSLSREFLFRLMADAGVPASTFAEVSA